MPRKPDPERKPVLLAQILDHLLDKPLASLTFRTIATSLGVSPYTLVYHFGTRGELISAIVKAISGRRVHIESRLQENPASVDAYFHGLEISWEWTLEPRNRELQRLEFEAALLESVDRDGHTFTRELYETWQRMGTNALVSLGLNATDAEVESRLLVDTFYGIQLDLVLNQDERQATAAFELAMSHHRNRIQNVIGASA